jgi:hypothetical protein
LQYIDGISFDISPDTGKAYLVLTDPGASPSSQLYTICLATGAATLVGPVASIINRIAVATTLPSAADLAVTVTDTPDPVQENGDVRYHFSVHNNGLDKAKGVKAIVACQNGSFVSTPHLLLV